MLDQSDSNSKKAETKGVTQAIKEHNAASILEPSTWSASPSSHSPNSQPEFAELPERYPADPDFQLRGTFQNPMIDAAMPLFGLVMRLRTLDDLPNILEVHQQVRTQVDNILEEMRQRGYESAQLLAYSYALCLYLDEAAMSRPWGRHSCWSQESLLSIFHHETWGGEKIYTVLSRLMQEPQRYIDVLEFLYLCLCLGLKGKYALAPNGDEAVNALLQQIYTLIREVRGPVPEQLCTPLANVAPSNFRMRRQWQWWAPLLMSAAAMAVVYGIYSYRLQLLTAEVLESLNHILQQ
ncbi:type IVB secretion system protein IcmH/DotU [Pseudomonas sp. CC120222-01a]|uniref:type IVB secretion system protein IcmH/DotU n=1 Tax=Pseudomonas sp. CC120222-01a TaxID=1378075 RepID=UPI000D9B5569|nr:type IVB secretion system protein IcmH/DotU [Pseudomonas sp. CC120222-01a]PVZ34431.1 type VI secretion system protein ImpK [Pseudomonas sp. CC120222-01a]